MLSPEDVKTAYNLVALRERLLAAGQQLLEGELTISARFERMLNCRLDIECLAEQGKALVIAELEQQIAEIDRKLRILAVDPTSASNKAHELEW